MLFFAFLPYLPSPSMFEAYLTPAAYIRAEELGIILKVLFRPAGVRASYSAR